MKKIKIINHYAAACCILPIFIIESNRIRCCYLDKLVYNLLSNKYTALHLCDSKLKCNLLRLRSDFVVWLLFADLRRFIWTAVAIADNNHSLYRQNSRLNRHFICQHNSHLRFFAYFLSSVVRFTINEYIFLVLSQIRCQPNEEEE